MKRKAFILLILTAIISISTVCFANTGNDIKNAVNGATNTVVDGAQNLAEDVRSGIQNAENTIENGARDIGTAITDGTNDVMRTDNNNGTDNTNGTAYTATRTTAADVTGTNTMTSSMWTWIILAVAAAVIVGLVWYYGMQHSDKH